MPFTLSSRMSATMKQKTGMTLEELRVAPVEDIDARIEAKLGHPLRSGREPGLVTKGSILIEFGETISPEELEAEIAQI